MRRLLVTLVVVGLFAACDTGDELPPRVVTTPEPSVSASPMPSLSPSPPDECPNRAIALDQDRGDNALEGPIDPDEVTDAAWIAFERSGEPGCRVFLIVENSGGRVGLAIDREGVPVGGGFPRPYALARIDERAGAEIVIAMLAGASTEFFAVFSMGSGSLERMTVEGDDEYDDLFPSGGSVGHLEASDCSGDIEDAGSIVSSIAVPRGRRYELTRTIYVSEEGIFRLDHIETETLREPQDLEAYQEFLGTPFTTCAPVG